MKIETYADSPERRAALFDFYRKAWPNTPHFLDAARFSWQSAHATILLLKEDDGRIVGHNLLLPYPLSVDGATVESFATTNLIILPEAAGRGLGRRIVEHSRTLRPLVWGIGSTPAALHILPRCGLERFEGPRLYLAPIDTAKCLRFSGIRQYLAIPAGVLLRLYGRIRSLSSANSSHLEDVKATEITQFDSEWDQCWRACLGDYGVYAVRNAEMLNRKYFSRSDVKHAAVIYEYASRPVGYVVYRLSAMPFKNRSETLLLGRIVDIVFEAGLKGLSGYIVADAVDRLKRMGAIEGIVGLAATGTLKAAYCVNGMFLSVPRPASFGMDLSRIKRKYREPWFLTLGDADFDDYT